MEEANNIFSIKDLENFSGIKAHTIRIWEKRYRILEPDRTESNIRFYNENELRKILNIAYLNRNGVKISRIAKFTDDELSGQVVKTSSSDNVDKDSRTGELLMSAIRFSDEQFRGSLNPYIEKHGLEKAYITYLYPLLVKARILWQTGSLARAQEQFIRNTIASLIIEENNRIITTAAPKGPAVAMINTSDNQNDINFLFYRYILRKRNFEVIFPGGILPASEVIEIHKIKPFGFLVVNSNSFDYLRKMSGHFSDIGKSMMIKRIIFADAQENTSIRNNNLIITSGPDGFIKAVD